MLRWAGSITVATGGEPSGALPSKSRKGIVKNHEDCVCLSTVLRSGLGDLRKLRARTTGNAQQHSTHGRLGVATEQGAARTREGRRCSCRLAPSPLYCAAPWRVSNVVYLY